MVTLFKLIPNFFIAVGTMQSLTKCVQRLLSGTSLNKFLQPNLTSSKQFVAGYLTRFEYYNKKFYPIQAPGEERRPAVSFIIIC